MRSSSTPRSRGPTTTCSPRCAPSPIASTRRWTTSANRSTPPAALVERRAASSGGRQLLFAEIADQPAGDDDLPFARKQIVSEDDRPVLLDLAVELVLAVRDPVQA